MTRSPPNSSKARSTSSWPKTQAAATAFQRVHARPARKKQANDTTPTTTPDCHPVKAYLRIRPHPTTRAYASSYFTPLDDATVSLVPPEDSSAFRTRKGATEQYQFSKVFTDTSQEQLYQETMAPLLQSFVNGNNALIFAYGVTNSGKTHTMLGHTDQPGLVYRTLNALFYALQPHIGNTKLMPVMHSSVQAYDDEASENRHLINGDLEDIAMTTDAPDDQLEVNPDFEYGLWLSFAEVYNEKVYDLLESPEVAKRSALPLKYEYKSGCKYISGIKHVKVKTIQDAYQIVAKGQKHRAAFSTLLNHASSRSHSIFNIHIVRCPIDKDDYVIEDSSYASLARLSLVDLAGSERYKNTQSEGVRLKEAGNINKSLMVLGQCMDVLRTNQAQIQAGKRPDMVPYRQSKLTELFKGIFDGDGSAAIIVNVNPFDTGYDENCHVMRFAASARQVTTKQTEPIVIDLENLEPNVTRRRRSGGLTTDQEATSAQETQTTVDAMRRQLDFLHKKWLDAETRNDKMATELRKLTEKRDPERIWSAFEQVKNTMNFFADYVLSNPPENKHFVQKYVSDVEDFHTELREHLDKLHTGLNATLGKPSKKASPTASMSSTTNALANEASTIDQFATFVQLRKQLRRYTHQKDRLLEDADAVLALIEQEEDVTFDLIRDTKLGKVLKIIIESTYEADPFGVQARAMQLLKTYARLPRTEPSSRDPTIELTEQPDDDEQKKTRSKKQVEPDSPCSIVGVYNYNYKNQCAFYDDDIIDEYPNRKRQRH